MIEYLIEKMMELFMLLVMIVVTCGSLIGVVHVGAYLVTGGSHDVYTSGPNIGKALHFDGDCINGVVSTEHYQLRDSTGALITCKEAK